MKPRSLIATSLLVILVVQAPLGAAQSGDDASGSQDEPQEDQDWRDEPRDLQLERTTGQLLFTSARSSQLGDDQLEVRYQRDTGHLEYRFRSFDAEGEGLQFVYEATIEALVEFRDNDQSGHWGLDADIIERYPLRELERRPLERQEILQGVGYQASAEYVIPDRQERDGGPLDDPPSLTEGLLRIEFTMVERPRSIAGNSLSPTELGFQVQIHDHPFTESDTRLALEMSVTGTRMQDLATLDHGFAQRAGHFESTFGWSPTSQVDRSGHDAAVTLVSLPEATGTQILLMSAYPRGDEITHDWTLQTTRYTEIVEDVMELLARGDVILFTGALLASLVIAGFPVARRLRET